MSNSIAKDFKFFSLLRFALPTMVMMIFMSLYSIVDGIFISRLLGTNALSAANIVYPVISIVFAVGIMLSTGGSALIAKKLGEGKEREAREDFSFLTLVSFLFGIAILLIGNIFIEPIVRALGSTDALLPYCVDYLSVSLLLAPAAMLQMMFQTFFVTAGKPLIGLMLTISGGVANMILDYLFMGPFNMGISGAALATGIGELIPAVIGLFYFLFTCHSLYLTKPVVRFQVLKESCFNGSSEMVTNLSTAVVTYLFNITMLKFLGEPGVAAITIVLYGQFLFNALYMGFSMGVAPVISYNHGSQNLPLLKRIFKICIGFISISSILITIMALVSSPVIVEIFTPIGSATYDIAKTGFFYQLHICRNKYLLILYVYCIFRRKGICADFFCSYFCFNCTQYSASPISYWSKRSMACSTGSRIYDSVSFCLFVLQEKRCLPLSLKNTRRFH